MSHSNFEENLIHVGVRDSGVSSEVTELTYEQMKLLREMIVVAIGTMEDRWRRSNQLRHPARASVPKPEPMEEVKVQEP